MALAADEKEVEDGGKDAVRVIFLACLCKRGLLVCWVVICYTIDVIEYDRRRSELADCTTLYETRHQYREIDL